MIDHTAAADEVDNFNDLTIEQRAAARRTVAAHSTDAQECREFLEMLGIAPTMERDVVPEVNRPKLPKTAHPGRRKPSMRRA